MNPLEALAFSVIMATLQQVIKDPKTKAAVENQMVNIGTLMLEEYGYTVTPPAGAAAV